MGNKQRIRESHVLAAILLVGMSAFAIFGLQQLDARPQAPSLFTATVSVMSPPKPIYYAHLVRAAGSDTESVHYTADELAVRPNNKMGIAEAPLDPGVVIRDPVLLHALPGEEPDDATRWAESYPTPAYSEIVDPASALPANWHYHYLMLGGYRRHLKPEYQCDDKDTPEHECEPPVEVGEPSMLALLVIGAVGLAAARRGQRT